MKGIGAGIGLISVLLGVAVIFFFMWGGPGNEGQVRPALEAKRDAEKLANAVSGRDDKGAAVTDSITFEVTRKGVEIRSVTPGGAMEQRYGLRPGDVIVEIGPLPADQFTTSHTAAADFMQAAYARPDAWTVRRGDQKITLPDQRNVGVEASSAQNDPTVPAPQQPQRRNATGQAMDIIQRIPSH